MNMRLFSVAFNYLILMYTHTLKITLIIPILWSIKINNNCQFGIMIIFHHLLLTRESLSRKQYGTYLRIHLETSRQSISDILYHYYNKWVRISFEICNAQKSSAWQIVAINFVVSYTWDFVLIRIPYTK